MQDDIKDVYLEAKSQGYDPKIMREVVKLRRMSPHDRAERDAILDVYRSAIVMCDLDGLSYSEIADAQNTTIGTVRSRIHRGRRLLRDIVLRSGAPLP